MLLFYTVAQIVFIFTLLTHCTRQNSYVIHPKYHQTLLTEVMIKPMLNCYATVLIAALRFLSVCPSVRPSVSLCVQIRVKMGVDRRCSCRPNYWQPIEAACYTRCCTTHGGSGCIAVAVRQVNQRGWDRSYS